jgi:ribonuclease E
MTRKNVSAGLLEHFSSKCEACAGRGVIIHEHVIEAEDLMSEVAIGDFE